MGKETTDYKTLKKHMPQPGDRLDRVENLLIAGMPDINFCSGGVECWIELKSPKEPKRASTPLFGSNHKLSQDQKNWFLRQRNAGGFAWLLIATDKNWMLIDSNDVDGVNEMTVLELMEASFWCAWKPIRNKEIWDDLRRSLRGHK